MSNVNLRSIRNKKKNMLDYFKLAELDFCVITEHWLNNENEVTELKAEWKYLNRIDMAIITRRRKNGGGVAVAVDMDKMKILKDDVSIQKYGVEAMAVLVQMNTHEKLIIIAIYSPPEKTSRENCQRVLNDIIGKLRQKYGGLKMIICGDFNRAIIDFEASYPFINKMIDLETRNGSKLDTIYLHQNFRIMKSETRDPIKCDEGDICSDHRVVFAELGITQLPNLISTVIPSTTLKKDAVDEIGKALTLTEWSSIITGNPNGDAERLSSLLSRLVKLNSRPVRKKKKNDKPWFDEHIKRLVRCKDRIYKKYGFGDQFKKAKKRLLEEIKKKKEIYVKNKLNILEKSDTSAFFTLVKDLSDPDANQAFDPVEASASQNIEEALDKISDHFVSVSKGFEHFEANAKHFCDGVEWNEFEKALKKVKVKSSNAINDINSKVLKAHLDILKYPIFTHIDNCFRLGTWPDIYKVETGICLPKTKHPTKVEEIRLISLTPFISKVMETIVLNRIEEVRTKGTNPRQFGGRKGVGTTHVIADYIQNVVDVCKNGKKAAGIFFDYSAAFNKGNRKDMIQGFETMGVKGQEIHMLSQLMTNRRISVKISGMTSEEKATEGGVGQGTPAGLYMYLAGSNDYNKNFPKTDPEFVNDYSYVDDVFALAKLNEELKMLWDDNGDIKKLYISQTLQKIAKSMEDFAEERKYKLNGTKTKIMIFGNDYENTTVQIICGDQPIEVVQKFKVLGVVLDPKLSMDEHIKHIEKKVASRIYVLRRLKQCGAPCEVLLKIYKCQLRSIIEYACPSFFSLLNDAQIYRLERLQNICIKTCTSFEYRSAEIREMYGIETIRDRFEKLTDGLILKESKLNNMNWFKQRQEIEYLSKLRNPREIEENQEIRQKNFTGPIAYFRRRLNYLLNDKDPRENSIR